MSNVPRTGWPVHPPVNVPSDQIYLTITIKGEDYDLRELRDCDPAAAVRAWELRKLPARMFPDSFYHAHQTREGYLACTCPDATYRHRLCKHLSALVQVGFLDDERPRTSCRSVAKAAELGISDERAQEPPF